MTNSEKRRTLLSMVSWEDRFLLGLERLLASERPQSVVLFQYDKWSERTDRNRHRALDTCRDAGCQVDEVRLEYEDPEGSWRAIRDATASVVPDEEEPIVDISTMPREAIWALFLFLGERGAGGRYAYHKPAGYGDWLSRDPGLPRVALKLAGEVRFGKDTVVLVVTGFDRERTAQIVRTFDPKVVQLAVQSGSQFGNNERNTREHKDILRSEGCSVEDFGVDAYSEDHGFSRLAAAVAPHVNDRNVVMASLGPKLSAVALFRVQKKYPSTGLVYTPSHEYNPEYSVGIGTTIVGPLPCT